MLRTIVAALAALAAAACTAAAPQAVSTPVGSAADPGLRRGVNVLGYDPIWTDPAKARFQARHFAEIRKGGFDFVRVNLQAFRFMDADNRLSPAFLERLDWIVREATAAGLSVILDEHDFNQCSSDVATCRVKLSAFWSQVAPRYRDAPPGVMFEPLNEPYGKLDAEAWNALFPQLLGIIRQTNPDRWVVIGPTRWYNFAELPTLTLPENDRRILATFHYYDPFNFTHQGASWAGDEVKGLKGVSWGTAAERAKIAADFDKVAVWSRATGRPVLLGEFGVYDKSGTPTDLRVAWTDFVAREAERRGFSWAYWQFDSDFLAWDMAKDDWVEPIHKALIPEAR